MCCIKSSCFLRKTLKVTSWRTSWLGGKSKDTSLKYLSLFGISFYWCLGLSVTVQLPSCVGLFATPWTAARQASLSLTISWSLLKLISIESVMPSNHLILCRPFLLLPSVFPSIRVFSNESAFSIKWLKFWSFSFSISPSNEYSGWFPLGLAGLISLHSKGLSRVLSNTTVQKCQFFGAQPSLLSNSHIWTWLLEKTKPWLDEPLSAKWCLCFLIRCLGLS